MEAFEMLKDTADTKVIAVTLPPANRNRHRKQKRLHCAQCGIGSTGPKLLSM